MSEEQDCARTSQIRATWAHVMHEGVLHPKKRTQQQQYPEHSILLQTEIIEPDDVNDVLIRDPSEATVIEMREWLDEHARRRYKMFARIQWTDNNFSIDRKFQGLLFKFADDNTAFFFKMVWYVGY